MPFDPTKTDIERVAESIDNDFDEAVVLIDTVHGAKTLVVSPKEGEDARNKANEIEAALSEKGLRTRVAKMGDDPLAYDVLATTGHWDDNA